MEVSDTSVETLLYFYLSHTWFDCCIMFALISYNRKLCSIVVSAAFETVLIAYILLERLDTY